MISQKKPGISPFKVNFSLQVFLNADYGDSENLKAIVSFLEKIYISIDANGGEVISKLRDKRKYSFKERDGKKCLRACTSYAYQGTKDIVDDEPYLDLWEGHIEMKESNSIYHIINYISSSRECSITGNSSNGDSKFSTLGVIWFLPDSSKRFENSLGLAAIDTVSFKVLLPQDFSFGNLVNGTKFVEQLTAVYKRPGPVILGPKKIPLICVNPLVLTFLHVEKRMELRFSLLHHPMELEYKLMFDYSSVKRVIISQTENGLKVYFYLLYPPKIFIATENLDPNLVDMEQSKLYASNNFNQVRNQESWTRWHECEYMESERIGRCSVFTLTLQNNREVREDVFDIVRHFYLWRRNINLEISFGPIEIIKGAHRPMETLDDIPFKVNYGLLCVQSLSYAMQDDLIINNQLNDFYIFIREEVEKGNADRLVDCFNELHKEYRSGKVYHLLPRIKSIFKHLSKERTSSSPYIKNIRIVLLTPTRKLFLPEMAFQSSQFLDIADEEYVLRAAIRDENMGDLSFAVVRNEEENKRQKATRESSKSSLPSPEQYFLAKCIEERLLPKLDLAGREYFIYGSSASQLRDRGMILYAKDLSGLDAKSIRDHIGKIEVDQLSKYIARVGLSLSQVLALVDLPPNIQVRLTEDVLDGCHPCSKNPYDFTDGCGLMSLEVCIHIWLELKRQEIIKRATLSTDDTEIMPTAYQIRFMGCKGMLVLDSNLQGSVIVLRKSMRKVDSRLTKLGILKISEPRRAYLNRPFVTILNQIGLPNDFFIHLLSNSIEDLVESFHNNSQASKALMMFSDLHRFIDHSKLSKLDYNLLADPFFRSSLQLAYQVGLNVIKRKARIPLNFKDARTLFGVADPTATYHLPYATIPTNNLDSQPQSVEICTPQGEVIYTAEPKQYNSLFLDEQTDLALHQATLQSSRSRKGLLKYGECFVFPSDFPKPKTGNLVITKFPCMHPGDVRKLKAVDHPELHHIRDALVFPVDGDRPHPNEMAGSDLDGDEYCVIWSSDFLRIKISQPMDFPDNSYKEKDVINDREIVRFFMRYMQEDEVGRIATTHLAHADNLPAGISSQLCKKLATKYSISLDFVKTGKSQTLSKNEKYHVAPDFLDNWSESPSYHSSKALGAIYRMVSVFEGYLADETDKLTEPSFDIRLTHPDYKTYEKQAIKDYETYYSSMTYLLDRSEYSTEVELFNQISVQSAGKFTNATLYRSNNHQDSLIYTIHNSFIKKMEKNFYDEFSTPEWRDKTKEEINAAYQAKASAYYITSMKKIKTSKKPYYGFPWIGRYSIHLAELLKVVNVGKSDPLMHKALPRKVAGGFNGSSYERNLEAKSSLQCLLEWLRYYLNLRNVNEKIFERIETEAKILFGKIAEHYISGWRVDENSCVILHQVMKLFKEKKRQFNFPQNIFDGCNEPISLMIVLILERTYYQGIKSSRIPDDSNNCWVVQTHRVLCGRKPDENEIEHFKELLKTISKCECITYTPRFNNTDNYKLSVYGSRASVLICQTIIAIHNRMRSLGSRFDRFDQTNNGCNNNHINGRNSRFNRNGQK